MVQNSNRGRRRGGNARASGRPASPQSGGRPAGGASGGRPATGPAPGPDRYSKFLPAWMKAADGSVNPPPRGPRGPRRARQPRPAGGYTPGKFAQDDVLR